MKLNKLLTAIAVVAPIAATIPATTSCNKNAIDAKELAEAEEYIKDRTFALAILDGEGEPVSAGTAWILSDATPGSLTDYNYYIATNWHVKLGFDSETNAQSLQYHFDEMGENTYAALAADAVTWKQDSNFYYDETTPSSDCAIDFFIGQIDFSKTTGGIPAAAKTKFDKLNKCQKEKGYINKFVKSTNKSNYVGYNMFVGGYPVKEYGTSSTTQKWNFEGILKGSNLWVEKGHVYSQSGHAGHAIDEQKGKTPTKWDQSPNYMHQQYYECEYNKTLQEYIPMGWSLSAGSSGSMVIAKEKDEWVVVGIYWGGWSVTEQSKRFFAPAFSIFYSDEKNFVKDYK